MDRGHRRLTRWARPRNTNPTAPVGPTRRVEELKNALDGLVVQALHAIEAENDHHPVLAEACDNFLKRGPELLDEATPYLWDYYRSVADDFSATQRRDLGIPELSPSTDIWDEVTFDFLPAIETGGVRYEPGLSYISFEGEVSWEREHGLQLVIEHGERVCKVGPYDGHHTNAHAYGDESLYGVIFR